MKWLAKLGMFFDKILVALFVLACIVLAFIWGSVSSEIMTRSFLGRSQIWVIEVVSYCLVAITFLSSAWVLRQDKHAKLDLVVNMLKPRAQARLNTITSGVATIMWLVIAWYTGELTWGLFQSGEQISTALEPLKAPLVVFIPVGSFLLFIQCLRETLGYLRKGGRAFGEQRGVSERDLGLPRELE